MGKHHQDSMSAQGAFHHAEIIDAQIRVPAGATNVYLLLDGSSATLPITKIFTRKREGRKLLLMVKPGQTITARITETTDELIVKGSVIDLDMLDSIELTCIKQVNGELAWTQTGHTDIT